MQPLPLTIPIDEDFLLRSYTAADAAGLYAAADVSRAHLRVWLNWVDTFKDETSAASFIANSAEKVSRQSDLFLGIFTKSGTQVGGAGLHEWDHYLKRAQIGYWLTADVAGRGLATRALTALVSWTFANLPISKIEIHIVAENKRSLAVARRLGAMTEGVLRRAYMLHGQLKDLVILGILKEEWKPGLPTARTDGKFVAKG